MDGGDPPLCASNGTAYRSPAQPPLPD